MNGENPGEAVISWDSVADAAFYRIAWIDATDAAAITENGGDWLDAIAYTNLAAAANAQYILTRLNPGVRYTFLVGSLRTKGGAPSWSAPAELDLAMGALELDQSESGYGYTMTAGGGVRYGPEQPVWDYVAENPPTFYRAGYPARSGCPTATR